MSNVIAQTPIRTSRSFLSPAHANIDPSLIPGPEGDEQPFAYAYAELWNPVVAPGPDPQAGHYDPESQTWVAPEGDITAGYSSYTSTNYPNIDHILDDICA
ncbi:hypothetical protein FE391_23025 [Nonomuraea sp. KC401]|uniref:hypothetical protein n=1 Tax=unclassified Nonomuraea TaxID=2593643 RepID=UPI0010FD483F|nr:MULTISPECIES: hypothetical protein [unclassified Nonomuraea]NBE96318.1 hypothetical protein [Nonomuraea sp. K271]TLF68216.1 hypothetical protein FE391_23025 [Nonomuraea sp. KC401]